ncbi:MAG TPA: DNA methyltransferase [Acidobacteriaceae bacterium]|nr:DNA methyltransferase [Acidobacteriaceae bacterium]
MPTSPKPREKNEPEWKIQLQKSADRLWKDARSSGIQKRHHLSSNATYVLSDALQFLSALPANSLHAIVTDPPYGKVEYEDKDLLKLRKGSGGIWRLPPAFDGAIRNPVPRFSILSHSDLMYLESFSAALAYSFLRVLVPGGHLIIASNPLLSTSTYGAIQASGFEKRGEFIRLVQTLRGGAKPKGAERDFSEVAVMPRSCWEPWGIFRKPFQGTMAINLRAWGTGGLRQVSSTEQLKDVITCPPTRPEERLMAPHPSLKPQKFLRQIVRASLPLGIGIVCDPFAGSGSTLAAAESLGYRAIGTDRDNLYFDMSKMAFGKLSTLIEKQ